MCTPPCQPRIQPRRGVEAAVSGDMLDSAFYIPAVLHSRGVRIVRWSARRGQHVLSSSCLLKDYYWCVGRGLNTVSRWAINQLCWYAAVGYCRYPTSPGDIKGTRFIGIIRLQYLSQKVISRAGGGSGGVGDSNSTIGNIWYIFGRLDEAAEIGG